MKGYVNREQKCSQCIHYFIICFIFLLIFLWSFPDCQGTEFNRIISLAPSITESIYHLGQEHRLIGVTSYCNHPEKVKDKEIIGEMLNPNLEKIYSLAPDLIVASKGINQLHTVEKLKSLHLHVVAFDEGNNIDEIFENFFQLGLLLGAQDKAEKIIQSVKERMHIMKGALHNDPPQKIFWQVGTNPLVTIGTNSFVNDFITYVGGKNIFDITAIKYPRVSREEVLKKNPDIIILIPMGDVTEHEQDAWSSFKELSAVKNNKIYVVDGDKLCRPTPLSFLAGLEELARLLHPEIFSSGK
ncbi:MAG: ABC transporter substrate-binding protein [bacterium]